MVVWCGGEKGLSRLSTRQNRRPPCPARVRRAGGTVRRLRGRVQTHGDLLAPLFPVLPFLQQPEPLPFCGLGALAMRLALRLVRFLFNETKGTEHTTCNNTGIAQRGSGSEPRLRHTCKGPVPGVAAPRLCDLACTRRGGRRVRRRVCWWAGQDRASPSSTRRTRLRTLKDDMATDRYAAQPAVVSGSPKRWVAPAPPTPNTPPAQAPARYRQMGPG